MERLGGVGALQETLVAALVSVGAIVISCFVATVVGHGGAEERDGRTEEVLATATTPFARPSPRSPWSRSAAPPGCSW